jgi:hypothetical protein
VKRAISMKKLSITQRGQKAYVDSYTGKCNPTIFAVMEKGESKMLTDAVNHPSHYTDGKIEVIEYIEDKKLDFCLGNAVKYISRAGKKDKNKTVEDLRKAIWYLERRIKEIEESENDCA